MHHDPRHDQRGFTLIELSFACFIILLLAAMLVPRVTAFINTAYQTRTVNDMRAIGSTWEGCAGNWSWRADDLLDPLDPTAGGFIELMLTDQDLINLFQCRDLTDTPTPSPRPPEDDAWGNPYRYFVTAPVGDPPNILVMVSCGSDGICDPSWNSGTYPPSQTANDIVWQNDCFFYYPS